MKARAMWRTTAAGALSNPLRTGLTMLGIVVGVAAVIAMLAVGNGARAAVEANFRYLGSDTVQIATKERWEQGELTPVGQPLTFEDGLSMSREVALVSGVSMRMARAVKARHGRANVELLATGAMAEALSEIALQNEVEPAHIAPGSVARSSDFVAQGRFFTPAEVLAGAEVCVLGADTAAALFGGEQAVDQVIWLNRRRCLVIGVLAELRVLNAAQQGQMRPNEAIYLPISAAMRMLTDESTSVQILARVVDEGRMGEARQQIARYLRARHGIAAASDSATDDDFVLTTRNDVLGAQQEAARTFAILLAAMAFISLFVGGVGIMNVMLVSVTERTREIGVRMAVGARPADIVWQFLLEAVLVSVGGGVLGVAVGILAAPAAAAMNGGVALLDPGSVPLSLGVAALTGVVFGLYPAVRAARLDPIEALRHE